MNYSALGKAELEKKAAELRREYDNYVSMGLSLDLSRGKPASDQLDISSGLLKEEITGEYKAENGFDCRNYGVGTGLPEMKRLFSQILGIPEKNIVVGGNSSLNLIYDSVARLMLYGAPGFQPWVKSGKIKVLCPVPGYDRHFAIFQSLGIEMIPVKMDENGPIMDSVEELVKDPSVKGLICVPRYSNPTGITFSGETVERLAAMKTAAPDFRIFWDNAYAIHTVFPDGDRPLADIFGFCRKHGNDDRVLYFTSTSKITFPGGGVSMLAASDRNLAQIVPIMGIQTIGFDKLNQLRHVKLLRSAEHTKEIMACHAALLAPKFSIVFNALEKGLDGLGIVSWHKPHGGYFVSLDLCKGCADKVWSMMKNAGVTMTGAGATYPYGKDPEDSNLRLAPTYSTVKDLEKTMEVLVCCIKLASVEKLISEK